MNKKILRSLIASSLAVGVINFSPIIFHAENNFQIVSVAYAKVENITASDSAMFDFGEDDEKIVNTVKNVAKMRAEQAAKEKAGIFVKSFSKTVNGMITDDDISVYTSNNIEILNVTYKKIPYQAHDITGKDMGKIGFAYEATVTAKIDTSDLQNYVKKDSEEKFNLIEQNKNSQKNIDEINKNFDELQNSSENVEQIKFKLASVNDRILANEKFDEGNKFFDKKNYHAAIEKYSDAIKLNPNKSAAYFNRAYCHEILKNYSQAIADYTDAITFNGSDIDAYNNRGNIYVNLKKYDEAISDFDKAISLKSNFATAYSNRGVVYYYLKNYSQSLKDFNKAIELGLNTRAAFGNRGIVLTKLEDYKNALKDLNKSVELGTTDGEVYFNRGICHKMLGNDSQADKDFSKAADLGYSS